MRGALTSTSDALPWIVSGLRLAHESVFGASSSLAVETRTDIDGAWCVRITCGCESGRVSFEEVINPRVDNRRLVSQQVGNNHDWLAHIDPQRLGEEPAAQLAAMSLG